MYKSNLILIVILISIVEFFNSKTTPDFSSDTTVLRYDTWYLFGVDYMSN